ncbi:MAG: DUF2332 domain-containing protein, partial [Acidimicrobiia bacterium]|nr:DUF2332 domain-containing protein [Acidimicrobiia bacterium]
LEVLEAVPPGQIEMNMLLAAVQYLLIGDPDQPLAAWYPSLGGARSAGDLLLDFAQFVMDHRAEINDLLATRLVQTNEVARCAFLLPAYNLVTEMTGLPIALIEVGTSAGLNQNVDRYGYRYVSKSETIELGPDSRVHLTSDTGDKVPATARSIPSIAWRAGIDINAIDITDADQARWLRSLVWPDQVDRHRRLAAAIAIAEDFPPTVVAGDAFDKVPELVAAAPAAAAVVVQHSFVLNQFARADRERLFEFLDELAQARPIYRIGAEQLTKGRGTILDLTTHGPNRSTQELAEVHHHGRWINWHNG